MEYFIFGLISLIIWGAILEYIISNGTKTKKRLFNDQIQIKLLTAIAEKLGVTKEEIAEILPGVRVHRKNRFW